MGDEGAGGKLTHTLLKSLLDYKDGKLYWKIRKASNALKGEEAGSTNKITGYRVVRVNGTLYLSHRLIWFYHHGYFPEGCIDHIDRNRLNNNLGNLREVSFQCNSRNCKKNSKNTSGVTGVSWFKQVSKWKSFIRINGVHIFLGDYFDFADAVAARLAAEQCVGWMGCSSTSSAYLFMEGYCGRI